MTAVLNNYVYAGVCPICSCWPDWLCREHENFEVLQHLICVTAQSSFIGGKKESGHKANSHMNRLRCPPRHSSLCLCLSRLVGSSEGISACTVMQEPENMWGQKRWDVCDGAVAELPTGLDPLTPHPPNSFGGPLTLMNTTDGRNLQLFPCVRTDVGELIRCVKAWSEQRDRVFQTFGLSVPVFTEATDGC